jgi:hypothetical protein
MTLLLNGEGGPTWITRLSSLIYRLCGYFGHKWEQAGIAFQTNEQPAKNYQCRRCGAEKREGRGRI